VSILYLIALLGFIVLPYYLCWLSRGFWEKQVTFYEHADVTFQGVLVVSYLDNAGKSSTFSNVKEINKMFESDWSAGVPTIQITKETDPNSGKMT